MVHHSEYDVAIVDGSIAGCTAATLFGRAGRKVALIESHPDISAYKQPCTTQILASATPTLQRLGLDRSIEAAGGIRNGFAVWTRRGWLRDLYEPEAAPYGYSIRREKLDPMVRQMAANTPGVELLLGHRARRLITDKGRIVGVGVEDREGQSREIMARLVVGADGRHSSVAEMADVGAARWKSHKRFGYYAFFENVKLASGNKAQFWFLEPDIAYALPMDDGLTILWCAPTKDKLAEFKRDIEGNFIRFIKNLPDAPRFDPARRVSKMIGVVDYPTVWRRRPLPGLAFIGDAAVTADYVWGVGCGWAFQSGEWLVEATADCFESEEALNGGVRQYRRRLRKELMGHFLLICDYQTGRGFNPIERLMFGAAAKDLVTAELVRDFGYRRIPIRQFLAPSALARAAWVNLTRRRPSEGEPPRLVAEEPPRQQERVGDPAPSLSDSEASKTLFYVGSRLKVKE